MHAGSIVSVDRIAEALWGEDLPAKPDVSIRSYVSNIRRSLAGVGVDAKSVVATATGGYRLEVGDDQVDARRFERLADLALRQTGAAVPAGAALDEALTLVGGTPFADFAYDDFASTERDRLEELILAVTERRFALAVDGGDSLGWLSRISATAALHPLREGLRATHMRALVASGRHAEALRAYADHRARMIDEVGLEPGPELRRLETEILALHDIEFDPGHADQQPSVTASEPTRERRLVTTVIIRLGPGSPAGDLDAVVRIATAHDAVLGGLDRVRGDVVVHVGYPIARERDTERGIRAAMAALAHSRDAAAAVVVQHVVVAAPGESDSEIATEIDGASRTEANSLIEQAAAGEILVSPSVAEVVEGHVELQKREDRHVAVGVRPVAAVARPAMLHGRDAELARVAELVDGAVQGRGSVVVVAGDAGIGKTVFIDDIARRFPGAVYRATGSPFHVATPLWPIARLFEGVPLENLPPVVAGWVERGEEALADIADPEERRAVIFDAIVDFALGADAPALWVFDDAHQLDATTRELVETLATSVGREPVLVAVLVRGVAEEHIDGLADANHLRLGPLDDKAVADIVRSASPHELSGSAVATLVARADGVPLFAAELARSWDGRGAELAGTADAEAVPIPLHGLFQARLDAAGVDRALLQAAAVLGDDFDRELLASVSAVAGVDTGLEALCGAGILTRRRRAGRVRYRFRHALIGEAAYAAVPAMRRADLHGRVVDAAAEHGIDDVEWVSLHLERAERWSDAIVMGSRAAQRSLELSAVTETLSLTERGLALVAKLESPGAEVEEAIGALWLARGVALVIREGPSGPGVRALYEYVDTELPTPLTPMQRFAARWGHWYAVSAGDRPAEALRLARAVHEAAVASGDPALLIEGHHVMWSSLLLAGEFEAVLAHTAEAITLYDADEHHWLTHAYGGHDPGVCMHSTAGLALWMLGDRDRARPRLLEALALADRIGHPYSRLEASFGPMAVAVLEEDGDFLQGEADALDAVSESGLLPVSAGGYVAGCRGVARVISDDRAGGIDQLRAAAGEWAELWGDYCLPFDTALALALIDAGGAEEALAHLDARWDPVEGSRWWDGEFLRVRGLARLAVGDVDGQADIERAADIAARQGAVGLARRAEADLAGPRA